MPQAIIRSRRSQRSREEDQHMDAQPSTSDLAAIKERQQKAWSVGDYSKIGVIFVIIAETLCESMDLRSGRRVLDVATGHGNAALAAARRFCEVVGIDYVPDVLEVGRKRAAAEGLVVDFRVGDAEDIPFPDASFDYVLSTLGAMFAPDQEKAASELLRVCKPGGKIGMANFTPNGFAGELGKLAAKYQQPPPSPGLKPPFLWGTEGRLRELLGDEVSSLEIQRRAFFFRYPSPRFYVELSRVHVGFMREVLEGLDASKQDALLGEWEDLVHRFNRSGDETMVMPSDYLEVVATRRRVP
jgi:SAM-dependent methyltransferase